MSEKIKCPFCGKIPETRFQCHMRKCIKENNIFYQNYEEIKVKVILYNWPEFQNKDFFIETYRKMSIPDFQKEYNNYLDPRILCRYYNIPTRTISEACQTLAQPKIKKFYEEKYGPGITNSLSKGTESFIKRNKTVKEKYGVDNVFQLDSVIDKIWNGDAYIKKYGCNKANYQSKKVKEAWLNKTDDEKEEWLKKSLWLKNSHSFFKENGITTSSLEKYIGKLLLEENFNIETQYCIKYSENSKRRWVFYDFFLKDFNVLIEVNGNYWHANPILYRENDEIIFPGGFTFKVKEIWQRDLRKKQIAEENSYYLITIWEEDCKTLTKENLKEQIVLKLKELIKNENSSSCKETKDKK